MDKKKFTGKIDNLVMGIILGSAIGSVLGLTLAPRKGKETREIIKQKGAEFVRDHRETFESAKFHLKKRRGFFRWLLTLIRGDRLEDRPMPRVTVGESPNTPDKD